MDALLSADAVKAVVTAIFEPAQPTVVEAYSAFEAEPRVFRSATELIRYVHDQRTLPGSSAHFAVHYLDMAGAILQSRVALDPAKCDGHSYRYKTEGWGLIWVLLQWQPSRVESFISANSQKRAAAWAPTYPEWGSPAEWDWTAVGRHLRRLRRVLKMAA